MSPASRGTSRPLSAGNPGARPGWLYAGLIVAMLVLFIAIMAWWPAAFAVRLFGTSYLTLGTLFGMLVIVAPVVFTAMHAWSGRGQESSDE